MSEPPKEERGEWTPDKVILMGVDDFALAHNIADAQNAALKAEHDRGVIEASQQSLKEIGEYQQLLKAERENSTRLACELCAAQAAIENIRTELEALQYHVDNNQREFAKAGIKSALHKCNVDLPALEQHDKDVERMARLDGWERGLKDNEAKRVKPLVDALEKLRKVKALGAWGHNLIDAVLPSVKEGKP